MGGIRQVVLRPDSEAPSRAREFCHEQLGELLDARDREVVEDASIVASELVTNAVNAGASRATVHLIVHPTHVRLDIEDDAPGQPRPQRPGPGQDHGRGLQIVAALSVGWGVESSASGKRVWAQLPLKTA